MVLLVSRPKEEARLPDFPVVTFATRNEANAARDRWNTVVIDVDTQLAELGRKVEAACLFQPGARPTNPKARGYNLHAGPDASRLVQQDAANVATDVGFHMALHRDLVRGLGFYDTLRRRQAALAPEPLEAPLPPLLGLPVTSFLPADAALVEAILEEALPQDRTRFREYLAQRPLGLGLITAVSPSLSSRALLSGSHANATHHRAPGSARQPP